MKNIIIYGLLMLSAASVLNSCRKIEQEMEPEPASKNMESMKIAPEFTWQTTKTVDVSLTAAVSGVILIAPPEGNYNYNKGFIAAGSVYHVRITIPSFVDRIRLSFNGRVNTVQLTGLILDYQLK